jgi:arylsulfatase
MQDVELARNVTITTVLSPGRRSFHLLAKGVSMQKSRPNIVFICADQLGAKFLDCYGGGAGSTPVLEKLGRDGAYFNRYYATHPVCAPNRATMLTGRSAEIHGITTNNLALATDMPTYAHVLREHGYRTGGFGKFHQTPMMWPAPTDLSWMGFDDCVVSEDPKWGPYLDWIQSEHPEHYDAALAMMNGQSGRQGPSAKAEKSQGASPEQIARRAGIYNEKLGSRIGASSWERAYTSPLPSELHDTVFITDKGIEFIETEKQGDAPFFCHISYVDPHDPYDPPEPYAGMFSPEDMSDPLPMEWRERGIQALERTYDTGYLNYKRIAENPAAIRKFRALYHGTLKLIDDQVGQIVDILKVTGLWENTIVLFSSDHGEHLGDHGMIAKGLPQYDAGIRCPLIVAGGPVERTGKVDTLTCTLDLYPTFCDWAAVPDSNRPPLEGLSFAGDCVGEGGVQLNARKAVSVSIGQTESVITDDGWRLTRFVDTGAGTGAGTGQGAGQGAGEGQMFNIGDDPDESVDLYDDPAFREKKIELLERLIALRNRPREVVNYRNLAVEDGSKIRFGGMAQPKVFKMYANEPSPWLTEQNERPEWKGRGDC